MRLAALLLAASVGAADVGGRVEEVAVRGGVHLQVPSRPNGVSLFRMLFYEAPEGGKPFWTSPSFHMAVLNGRARFNGALFRTFFLGPDQVARGKVYVEFKAETDTVLPRYMAETVLVATARPVGRVGRFQWGMVNRRDFALNVKLIEPVRAAPAPRAIWGGLPSLQAAADDWSDIPLLLTAAPRIIAAPVKGARVEREKTRRTFEEALRRAVKKAEKTTTPPPQLPRPPVGGARHEARRVAQQHDAELRLSRALYFESLRDYRAGNYALVLAKLHLASTLNPKDDDIRAALERMRQETRVPVTSQAAGGVLPSIEAMQQSYDLYFSALRQYSKGSPQLAHDTLRRASALDPANEGVGNALRRLERELAGWDDAH